VNAASEKRRERVLCRPLGGMGPVSQKYVPPYAQVGRGLPLSVVASRRSEMEN